MKLVYPAYFHKAEEGGFWISFPDIPECLTQGDDMAEAYEMAIDALGLALGDRIKEKDIPVPTEIDKLSPEDDAYVALIEFDLKEAIPMTDTEYLRDRLDDQINWYSKKSTTAQRKYKVFQCIEIVLAACIPILTALNALTAFNNIPLSIIGGGIGSAIVIIEAICKMNKYHENWIQYRYISELLKHEKYLYLTKTDPYDGANDPFNLLVQKVERAISSENVNWVGINENRKKELQ